MSNVLLSLALVLSVAGIASADEAEKDLKKLVGTWQTVSNVADGKKVAVDEVKGMTIVIDAAGKWQALNDGTAFLKGTVKLDPSKSPKAADWAIDGTDMVVPGIYEVDGDTFKHCFAMTERPKAFESKEGSGVNYSVLKRVKK